MNALLLLLAVSQDGPDFGASWDQASRSIRQLYYAREARRADMDRLLAQYEGKAKAAKSKAEFRDIVNQMIDDFKDSHFALLTDDEQGYYNFESLAKKDPAPMPHIGAWFKNTKDGYTVQMVLNGTEAEKADIRKGDLMLTVDGKPFGPITPLMDKEGSKVLVTLRRNGKEYSKSVQVEKASAKKVFADAMRSSARIIEKDGKKIGYVHLWTMADEDTKSYLSNVAYGKFRDTDAMILDLRDGFGGRPEGYGDPFFRPDVTLEWKFGPTMGQKQAFGYAKPLAVLINGGSRSAKEVFSYIMKKSKRATLVGTTTAGHVLGTTPMKLNDWAYLEIPIVDVITDGVRIEGKGVAPDVLVKAEFDESGKDLYVEKGVEVLLKKIKR